MEHRLKRILCAVDLLSVGYSDYRVNGDFRLILSYFLMTDFRQHLPQFLRQNLSG